MIRLCYLFLLLLTCQQILAQESGTIYGHISDAVENSEPMIFAEVGLKNTSFSTQTNFYGNFELSGIEFGNYMLTINYAGYEPIEIPVTIDRTSRVYIDRSMHPRSVDNLMSKVSDNDAQSLGEAYPASER